MGKGIGRVFLEKTRYTHLKMSDQTKGIPNPPLELPPDSDANRIELPRLGDWDVTPVTVTEAITNRGSVREYADTPLSLGELSYLLWCTQGVKEVMTGVATLRTVPSAGARHAFETCLLVNRVSGLEPGLYRFLAIDHELEEVNPERTIVDGITRGCLGQETVKRSAVTFIWTAVPYRMTWRYGERGYRYLLLDAGHVCQNLYLAAQAVGCGVCAIAAFDDEVMDRELGLDGNDQFVIYIAAVGKRRL